MELHPVFDRLLVRRQTLEEHLGLDTSLLSVPDSARERWERVPQYADVLAVGPEVKITQPGGRIVCGRWAGTDIEIEGVPCIIIRENEILALVE